MKRLIQNARILTMDAQMRALDPGWILLEDDRIRDLGEMPGDPAALPPADESIDAERGIVLPGLINTHCHVSMMPFRGLGDDCPDRLRRFLFPLENEAMTEELVYRAARYGAGEMLLAGVTTFVDMYYFEHQVARACDEMGMRAVLGETVIGQQTCDSRTPYGGLALAERFVKEWKGHPRIRPAVAPHATNTNSPEMLKKAKRLADEYDTLLTLHASEMDYELAYFRENFGKTPVEFLKALDLLGPRLLAAHCIHLTGDDIRLLAGSGTAVSHCIGSNTKAGKGVAPVKALLLAGVKTGLGTDGASSGNTLDLFTQFRLFASFHKTKNRDRSLFPASEIVALGTKGGAQALGMEREIGSLEPGKKADLILVETKSMNMFPCYDPYSALVYSANASNVEMTVADGEILVRDKKLVRAQEGKLRAQMEEEMGAFVRAAAKY